MKSTQMADDPVDALVRKNLIRFREEADMSQADAAAASGVDVANIRRYEKGETPWAISGGGSGCGRPATRPRSSTSTTSITWTRWRACFMSPQR